MFDEGDLVANTNQLEYSITNRLFAKRTPTSSAQEVFSWELKQQYYFDPNFGGIVQTGQRNVFVPTLDFSGNAFLTTPRRFSPIISIFASDLLPITTWSFGRTTTPPWPVHECCVSDTSISARLSRPKANSWCARRIFFLLPPIRLTLRWDMGTGPGRLQCRVTTAYDIRAGYMQFSAFQVSYNNNCCGISVEFRRFALGPVRNENQYRMAFSLANIGTFGNLKKEERLF